MAQFKEEVVELGCLEGLVELDYVQVLSFHQDVLLHMHLVKFVYPKSQIILFFKDTQKGNMRNYQKFSMMCVDNSGK